MQTTRAISSFCGRSCRGTASVEAVVVLPIFIIIFASVLYVRSQVLSRQAAETKARACAWAYSMNSCETIPPGCRGVLQPGRAAAKVRDEIETAISKATGGLVGPVIAKVLEPALDAAYGQSLDANTTESFSRPSLYGGGTATTTGSYHLACNLHSEQLLDVAKDVWHALSKF